MPIKLHKIQLSIFFHLMILLSGISMILNCYIEPKDRFKPSYNIIRFGAFKGEGIELNKIYRSYTFDKVTAVSPGNDLFNTIYITDISGSIFLHKESISYNGRAGNNSVKLSHYIHDEFSELSFVIIDTTEILEFYLDNPNEVNRIRIGSVEKPDYLIEITLDESNLYYQVIADWLSPLLK